MTTNGVLQALSYLAVLLILVKPLGSYMARVYSGGNLPPFRFLAPFERRLFRWCGVTPENEMAWKEYAGAVLLFSAAGWLLLFLVQRVQGFLPLNPQRLSAVAPTLAFNTAVSFVTNTNWQAYAGETAMSYLTQMLGLTAQNFLSAASGMAVLAAFVRGLKRNVSGTIGNFWTDLIRTVLYILLPLAVLLAVALVSQGVVQSLDPAVRIPLLQGTRDSAGKAVTEQIIPMGPAASQIAIKQIGTNGGGFFNANSAHPFENPTPITNALEMLAILLLPAALCYTFGRMVKDTRQGWAILAAMLLVFIPMLILCLWSEQAGNPVLSRLGVDQTAVAGQAGGNMEGKEVRFGIVNSALWAAATTAASNGSVLGKSTEASSAN